MVVSASSQDTCTRTSHLPGLDCMNGCIPEDFISRNGVLLSGIIRRDQYLGSQLLKIGRLPYEGLAQLPKEEVTLRNAWQLSV